MDYSCSGSGRFNNLVLSPRTYFIDIHVQIQSFDNYTLVISLAIRQRSEDLKHLISGNGLPEITRLAFIDLPAGLGVLGALFCLWGKVGGAIPKLDP